MATKIQSLPLAVVINLAKAELMESYRTHDVQVLNVGLYEADDDFENEQSIMVTATVNSEEECFAADCGKHLWLMSWNEDECDFYRLIRWDIAVEHVEDEDELPPNVVARLDYAAQPLGSLELSPADDVDVNEELPHAVTNIRMDYPFEIKGGGSYNVYKIAPAKTWGELLTETIKVFQREYLAGKAIAPHELSDYIIERVDVHPNDLATICIGS